MTPSKQTEIIQSTLEQLKEIVDVNTVMGAPIETAAGVTIIPVTKVSVGLATAGLDYFSKNLPEKLQDKEAANFAGGGGSGVSVQPVGFLVVKPTGSVELLSVAAASNASTATNIMDTAIEFIERSPELIARLKAVLGKNGTKNDMSEAEKAILEAHSVKEE
ncbi:MAG: sporulation protein YtfJ [Ruminococcaceae bacterium]|nr:sporulation protein YtfJ [Oscillospiraceae bacterium]